MKTKNIAFIVCDSGIGHLLRSLKIANEIVNLNINIYFFCNKKKLKKVFFKINKKIIFKNFISGHDKELDYKNYNYEIAEKLPNLKNFDIVISDNLPEVLYVHKNVLLVANFFWHKVLKNYKNSKKLDNLIKKERPLIFCNRYVSHEYIDIYKNKIKLGFFSNFQKKIKKNVPILLISEGTSKTDLSNKYELIKYIKHIGFYFKKIFLDPKYFSDKKFHELIKGINKNVCLAKYDKKMFNQITHAIIKPGLGIVTSCISNRIDCLYFYKNFNKEFEYNTKKLEKYKIGKRLNYKNIMKFQRNLKYSKLSYKDYSKLEWFAHKKAAEKILQILNFRY